MLYPILNKQSQSLMEVLIRLMPELRVIRKQITDPKLANLLYNQIWSSTDNRLEAKKFRRPEDVKMADVRKLADADLVRITGDNIEITEKGAGVIRQMILGDDRSVFEEDGKPTEYLSALANLDPSRLKKSAKTKRASANHHDRPLGGNWYSLMLETVPCANCCRKNA